MIHFNFTLSNPWHKNRFKNLWSQAWLLPKCKGVELEVTWTDYTVMGIDFSLRFRQDHAGLRSEVTIGGYCFSFNFYDTRHWDHNNNTWQVYDAAYLRKQNDIN